MPGLRFPVVLAVVAGAFAVVAAMADAPREASWCGAAALAALTMYVILDASGSQRRVRRTVMAGLALLVLVWVAKAHWQAGQLGSPLDAAGVWERVNDAWLEALGSFGGVLLLAAAVFALPPVRSRRRQALGAALALFVAVVIGAAAWAGAGDLDVLPPRRDRVLSETCHPCSRSSSPMRGLP